MTTDEQIKLINILCDVMYADPLQKDMFCTFNFHHYQDESMSYYIGHIALLSNINEMSYVCNAIPGSIWEGNTIEKLVDYMFDWTLSQWEQWKVGGVVSLTFDRMQ